MGIAGDSILHSGGLRGQSRPVECHTTRRYDGYACRNQPGVALAADRAASPSKAKHVSHLPAPEPAPVIIPTPAVRSYLQLFGCIAITVTDGRIGVCRDPFTPICRRMDAVWWVHNAAAAISIREQCEAEETSDVVSVAAGLRIGITSNAAVIANAERAIGRMNVLVAQAQQAGLMKMLNSRYRAKRMKARAEGRSFPAYATVHRHFVQSLLRIASGEVPRRSLVEMALGISHEATQPDSRGRL